MARKILKGIGSVLPLAGAVGGLASKIIGGKKKATAAPTPDTPTVMPIADDEKVRLARKRSIVQQMGRKGRESTILAGDRLGG